MFYKMIFWTLKVAYVTISRQKEADGYWRLLFALTDNRVKEVNFLIVVE